MREISLGPSMIENWENAWPCSNILMGSIWFGLSVWNRDRITEWLNDMRLMWSMPHVQLRYRETKGWLINDQHNDGIIVCLPDSMMGSSFALDGKIFMWLGGGGVLLEANHRLCRWAVVPCTSGSLLVMCASGSTCIDTANVVMNLKGRTQRTVRRWFTHQMIWWSFGSCIVCYNTVWLICMGYRSLSNREKQKVNVLTIHDRVPWWTRPCTTVCFIRACTGSCEGSCVYTTVWHDAHGRVPTVTVIT